MVLVKLGLMIFTYLEKLKEKTMNYEIFIYTKTSRDDWDFHVVPKSMTLIEINKVRKIIVDGLYSSYPSISRNEIKEFQLAAVGSNFNFCYFLPTENGVILILSRVARVTDYTGRPFWDFVGAFISYSKNSLSEIKDSLPYFFSNDILFKTVDEIIDQENSSPKPPLISKNYTVDFDTMMQRDEYQDKTEEEDSFISAEELSNSMLFLEETPVDYKKLISILNSQELPLMFFSLGPINKNMILDVSDFKINNFKQRSEFNSNTSIEDVEQNGTKTSTDNKKKNNKSLLNSTLEPIIYSFSVVDVILSKMKARKKK